MSPIYIHCGSNGYNPLKFQTPRNEPFWNKPFGGLWASRVDAKYGWMDFCEDQDFCTESLKSHFSFQISDIASVVEIHHIEDLESLPKQRSATPLDLVQLDFEKMMRDGVDAIELFLSEDFRLYWELYGWDCDSILILNKEIIIPGKKGKCG